MSKSKKEKLLAILEYREASTPDKINSFLDIIRYSEMLKTTRMQLIELKSKFSGRMKNEIGRNIRVSEESEIRLAKLLLSYCLDKGANEEEAESWTNAERIIFLETKRD